MYIPIRRAPATAAQPSASAPTDVALVGIVCGVPGPDHFGAGDTLGRMEGAVVRRLTAIPARCHTLPYLPRPAGKQLQSCVFAMSKSVFRPFAAAAIWTAPSGTAGTIEIYAILPNLLKCPSLILLFCFINFFFLKFQNSKKKGQTPFQPPRRLRNFPGGGACHAKWLLSDPGGVSQFCSGRRGCSLVGFDPLQP